MNIHLDLIEGYQNTGVTCFSELFKQAVISKAITMDEITGKKYKHYM